MNRTKTGINAGVATRNVINKATGTGVSGAQSVATVVAGFFRGLIAGEPAPKAMYKTVVRKPQAKTVAKAKSAKTSKSSTKSN